MKPKPNLCRACGEWSQCERAFRRFLDQAKCRFAVRAPERDECESTDESGLCNHKGAQAEARGK
jgi:hypothetical protein